MDCCVDNWKKCWNDGWEDPTTFLENSIHEDVLDISDSDDIFANPDLDPSKTTPDWPKPISDCTMPSPDLSKSVSEPPDFDFPSTILKIDQLIHSMKKIMISGGAFICHTFIANQQQLSSFCNNPDCVKYIADSFSTFWSRVKYSYLSSNDYIQTILGILDLFTKEHSRALRKTDFSLLFKAACKCPNNYLTFVSLVTHLSAKIPPDIIPFNAIFYKICGDLCKRFKSDDQEALLELLKVPVLESQSSALESTDVNLESDGPWGIVIPEDLESKYDMGSPGYIWQEDLLQFLMTCLWKNILKPEQFSNLIDHLKPSLITPLFFLKQCYYIKSKVIQTLFNFNEDLRPFIWSYNLEIVLCGDISTDHLIVTGEFLQNHIEEMSQSQFEPSDFESFLQLIQSRISKIDEILKNRENEQPLFDARLNNENIPTDADERIPEGVSDNSKFGGFSIQEINSIVNPNFEYTSIDIYSENLYPQKLSKAKTLISQICDSRKKMPAVR